MGPIRCQTAAAAEGRTVCGTTGPGSRGRPTSFSGGTAQTSKTCRESGTECSGSATSPEGRGGDGGPTKPPPVGRSRVRQHTQQGARPSLVLFCTILPCRCFSDAFRAVATVWCRNRPHRCIRRPQITPGSGSGASKPGPLAPVVTSHPTPLTYIIRLSLVPPDTNAANSTRATDLGGDPT